MPTGPLSDQLSRPYLWVDFHINVPGQTPIRDAHAIASAIEHEIEESFGEADATAHVEDCKDDGELF